MLTRQLVERVTCYNSISPINHMTGIAEIHELWPIPQGEIELNKDAVLKQNPGY